MRTCANYLSTVKDVVVSISDMKKSRYACGLCEKPYAYKQDATNEMLQGTYPLFLQTWCSVMHLSRISNTAIILTKFSKI